MEEAKKYFERKENFYILFNAEEANKGKKIV
jgi:hypothetical protein